MVTKVIFLGKSIGTFQKWTKKMSKIEKTKKLLDNFFIKKLINRQKTNQIVLLTIWHYNERYHIILLKKKLIPKNVL
jgi:hypothetical protein